MSQFTEFSPGRPFDPNKIRSEFSHLGENTKIFPGCRIVPASLVSVGDYSQIDEGVYIFAGEGVEIGRNVHLAACSTISGGGKCSIDDFAGIGVGVRLITGSEDPHGGGLTNPTIPEEYRSVTRGEITIAKHALVFTNSVVFPGVTIGEGAVVSAGSIVHKNLEPWTIYAGNPLVAVGKRNREEILETSKKFLSIPR